MKNFISAFMAVICVFGMIGCNFQKSKNNWNQQEILAIFEDAKEENWDILDCVVMNDSAYDMVGAVLFWDKEKEATNVAFFDADGHYQHCGTSAKTPDKAEFSYLGNGAVSFNLIKDDNTVYNYILTISIDGDKVHFKAEDDLINHK